MSTVFNIEQAFQVAGTDPVSAAKMRQWANVDPHALAGRPDLLQQCLYWKAQLERTVQSPLVQQSITAQTPGLNIPASPGVSIHDAARRGLYGQQPAQVQQAQVRRGPQVTLQQAPDPALQKAARDLQRAINELPGRLASAVQRSQAQATRRPVQKSAAAQPVQRSQAAKPPLPISPITGAPSPLTALVRRSVGLDGGEVLNQHPYYLEQQRKAEVNAHGAPSEADPISPITGQPSSLTGLVRRSVGL